MKRILLGLLFALAMAGGVHAQTLNGVTVSACGGSSLPLSQFFPLQMLQNGEVCTTSTGGSSGNPTVVSQGPQDSTALPWLIEAGSGAFVLGSFATGAIADLYSASPPTPYAGSGAATAIAELDALRQNSLLPPATSVSGTPTAWGGTTDGSYSDGWMDLRAYGGVAVGAMANYGTSPGAVKVPGVNAYVTNTPSVAFPVNITEHDCSVTITSGGTAQNAFAATATIHGFRVANIDSGHNDEVAWFSTTTTAAASTAQSFPLPPPTATTFAGFGSYTSPAGEGVNTALSVVAATTGHIISCTYW